VVGELALVSAMHNIIDATLCVHLIEVFAITLLAIRIYHYDGLGGLLC